MTAPATTAVPGQAVSVHRLHGCADVMRLVAREAPRLEPRVRAELEHTSTLLDTLADREREVERIFENGGA